MASFYTKVKAGMSFLKLSQDIYKLDEVFELSRQLAEPEVLSSMAEEVRKAPYGERALLEKPRIGKLNLDELRQLEPGTQGRVFADHMIENHLTPEDIPTLEAQDDLEYLLAHLYETHDIWHVVTGFDTTPSGELGLQAFYLAQLPGRLSPALLSAGLLNMAIKAPEERMSRMDAITSGWLAGKKARLLFGVDWKAMWNVPLHQVRAELSI